MFKASIVSVSVFVLASLSASAAEPTRLPNNVVAQVRVFGSFGPAPQGAHGIRVLADGSVVSFVQAPRQQETVIARLSQSKLTELRAIADQVRISRLVDPDAELPSCMDAPSAEYAVNTSRAGAFVIARRIGCHDLLSQDGPSMQLLDALKGLEALDRLRDRF